MYIACVAWEIKKTRRISFSEIAIFKDFKVGQLSISQVMIVSDLVFCSWFMSLPRFTSEKLTPLRHNSTVYAFSFFFYSNLMPHSNFFTLWKTSCNCEKLICNLRAKKMPMSQFDVLTTLRGLKLLHAFAHPP